MFSAFSIHYLYLYLDTSKKWVWPKRKRFKYEALESAEYAGEKNQKQKQKLGPWQHLSLSYITPVT